VEQGTPRILEGRCPNLLAEAGLYRYGSTTERDTEAPVDEHNHALAALRYVISRLDARRMAKMAKRNPAGDGVRDDNGQADASSGDGPGHVTKRAAGRGGRRWRMSPY
jgi:hypothetical protein